MQLLLAGPRIAPTSGGVLIIVDTGDYKDGGFTDHVARQYLGSAGKIHNGNDPLHVVPYTPECRLLAGKQDPAFHTKPRLALDLMERATAAGIAFKVIVADSA